MNKDKMECSGCGACVTICPAGAISMKMDERGFAYPCVDHIKCSRCGKCERICAFVYDLHHEENRGGYINVFAAKAKDTQVQYRCSSGGIGHLLADAALKQDFCVYGCVLDGSIVHHRRIVEAGELDGSKYVQSNMEGVFSKIQADLRMGRKVLFFGVACQTAALRKLLGTNNNLFTVDVLCHGVPSPGVFQKYINWLESRKKSPVQSIIFRRKTNGWRSCIDGNTVCHANGSNSSLNLFYSLYFSHIILRPSCTMCPYTCINKPSDITLCDFWNVEDYAPNLNSRNGVSRVLVHNENGVLLFNSITKEIDMEEVSLLCCNSKQFVSPPSLSRNADQFYRIYTKSASLAFLYHQGSCFKKSLLKKLRIGGNK